MAPGRHHRRHIAAAAAVAAAPSLSCCRRAPPAAAAAGQAVQTAGAAAAAAQAAGRAAPPPGGAVMPTAPRCGAHAPAAVAGAALPACSMRTQTQCMLAARAQVQSCPGGASLGPAAGRITVHKQRAKLLFELDRAQARAASQAGAAAQVGSAGMRACASTTHTPPTLAVQYASVHASVTPPCCGCCR